jgi:hypothetical protein
MGSRLGEHLDELDALADANFGMNCTAITAF